MAREPQKATSKKHNAASEENNQQKQNDQPNRQLLRLIDLTGGREQHAEEQAYNVVVGQRRVAPEYTLVWSKDVLQTLKGRPEKYVRKVTAAAYARIYISEAVLYRLKFLYVLVLSDEMVDELTGWWRAFKVGNSWFRLKYHDKRIREYELLPADGPSPPDESPPKQTRWQTSPAPKSIGRRPRVRRDRSGVTDILNAAPPRRGKRKRDNKRIMIEAFVRAALELQVLRSDIADYITAVTRTLWPRLLSNLVRIKQTSGSALRAMCDARIENVGVVRHCAALARSLHQSLRTSTAHVSSAVRSEARLESRIVGQNTGLSLVLSSWSRSEPPPVDWSLWLFGVDWTLNIFGIPEEEQAFT